MDRRLRVNNHLDLVRWQVEQTTSLYHLESLVHQGRRINGNSPAHLPGGMVQSFLYGDGRKLPLGRMQERAARRGQPNPLYFFHPPATQALMHRIVLAVDGEQWFALPPGFGGIQFTGGYQTLVVRETYRFSSLDRFVGGFQPRNANDGANHEINFWMRSYADVTARAVHDLDVDEPCGL